MAKKGVKATLIAAGQVVFDKISKAAATAKYNQVKDYIISAVESHPVCAELRQHTSPSQFLPKTDGTLFGFMGFEAGTDPVSDLVEYLRNSITLIPVGRGAIARKYEISLPTFEEMAAESSLQLPWLSGQSWPEALEEGIYGLRHFLSFTDDDLYVPPNSRSQEGVQAKGPDGELIKIRNAEMKKIKFLSLIFERALKK